MRDVLLFSHDRDYAAAALACGMAAVVVDWEWRGKAERQCGHDTQINHGTVADLAAMTAVAGDRVVCRINNVPGQREFECEQAIAHGAAEIWLPMVRGVAEVEACLRAIDGRARLGIMVETREAMALGRELSALPLHRAYVGLQDYRIDHGHAGLFEPIIDGTLDRFREDYAGAFGFAGVTLPTGGRPIPQHLLLAGMLRLGCAFGVARRMFRADVPAAAIGDALADIARASAQLALRPAAQVDADHAALAAAIAHVGRPDAAAPQEAACAS
jgi:hypothetical protein